MLFFPRRISYESISDKVTHFQIKKYSEKGIHMEIVPNPTCGDNEVKIKITHLLESRLFLTSGKVDDIYIP